jgi:inner membrane protein
MDPVTQGLLGAAAAQLVLHKRLGKRAWLYGAIGGMAADLDVLIRDPVDPLVGWTYHRHFTHSLAFIVPGGLFSSIPWVFRKRFREQRWWIVAATTVGYATHALLDAFTSYGTQLWWPFSNTREAWNSVGIIDPIVTGALAVGVILTARRDRLRPVAIGLAVAVLYIFSGFIQRARALEMVERVAIERGDTPSRTEAYPLPLSNMVWRGLYVARGQIHAVGVHVPWWGEPTTLYGGAVTLAGEPPADVAADPRTAEGFRTLAWFADRWLAREDDHRFADVRFSLAPASVDGIWGAEFHPGEDPAVTGYQRPRDVDLGSFLGVIFGGFPG